MKRAILITLALASLVAGALVVGFSHSVPTATASSESKAKAVATRFMRTLNAKEFEQACRMMSDRFYRVNHVPNQARCVLGFRVGFMGAPEVRFEILAVEVDADRAVVQALADGAPGRVVLVKEHGVFKVLSLRGA